MDRLAFESAYTLARKVAHWKALSALGRCGIVPDELEDVESELLLDFYQRFTRFDSRRASLGTFAGRVMESKLVGILRHRLAQRRVVSILTEPLPDEDLHLPSPAPQWELRLEVERVLATLPPVLAELASALCWMSPTEAGRFLGCTRTTVYGRIAKLRAALLEAGIGRDHCLCTVRAAPATVGCEGHLKLTASSEIPKTETRNSNQPTRTVAGVAELPAKSSKGFLAREALPRAAPSAFQEEVTC